MTSKRCSECRITKPLEQFARDAGKRSGYGALCKLCDAERSAARYAKQRAAQLAKVRLSDRRQRRRRVT